MPEISILHPTRSRPDKSRQTIDKWKARAAVDLEVIVSLDTDDPELRRYLNIHPDAIINPNRSAVDAVNRAAEVATGRIMVVVSDDTDCPHGWGKTILKATQGKKDFVLKVYDGTQVWIVTQPIIDRFYYERFGYLYDPDFKHMFVDTMFTHVADALKKIIWRNDILFPHKHYSVTRQRPDAVNRRADATWNDGKRIYLRKVRRNLGLPKEVNIMLLSRYARAHLKWLRAHGV